MGLSQKWKKTLPDSKSSLKNLKTVDQEFYS